MGADYSNSTGSALTTDQLLSVYNNAVPSITNTVSNQVVPNTANLQTNAANQLYNTGTGYNAINYNNLANYAVPMANVGNDVTRTNALAGGLTNLEQLAGTGGASAALSSNLARQLNPEYYQGLQQGVNKSSDLLKNITTTGLSPGEANATERALNNSLTQTGNLGLDNSTNAISNAMNFGGAYNSKLNLLNNAIGTNTGVTNSAGSSYYSPTSIFQTGTAQPDSSAKTNFGTSQFQSASPSSTSDTLNYSSSLLNGLFGNTTSSSNTGTSSNASMYNTNASVDSLNSYLNTGSSMLKNLGCCFIFLEAYHGKLPKQVRKGRDRVYKLNKDIAVGYRRTAVWLVPLMQECGFVRKAVWHLMVKPITTHLKKPKNNLNKRIAHFWLNLWAMLGKGKTEEQYLTKAEAVWYGRL